MFKTTPSANGIPTLIIQRVTGAHGSKGKPISYSTSEVAHELQPVRYTGKISCDRLLSVARLDIGNAYEQLLVSRRERIV